MRYDRCGGPAAVLLAVCALGLGACRHVDEAASESYGSLKDHVAAPGHAKVAPKPAKAKAAAVEAPAKMAAAPKAPAAVVPAAAPAVASATVTPSAVVKPAAPPAAAVAPAATPPPAAQAATAVVATPPAPKAEDPVLVKTALSEGRALFDAGKVMQARRRFIEAMSTSNPEIVHALGRTYDTYYLTRLPTADGAPDMQRALVLYERAVERGASGASPDAERTRGFLKMPR
ncbi:MAG: hypothetical protein AB7O57_01490 [Hyphomicrobiaceae bacterium]